MVCGSVGGIGIRTHTTHEGTFIRHQPPVGSMQKTPSGRTIIEMSVESFLNTLESVSRHCGTNHSVDTILIFSPRLTDSVTELKIDW